MADRSTDRQRLSNRLFAIPAVAQAWAKLSARRTNRTLDLDAIPFAALTKPLSQCRVALLTTGGVHLRAQSPFDMDDPDGDATYREIPADAETSQLMITHKYYDHTDADQDMNIVFPLDRFRELADWGVIGGMARRHFAFMGHIDGPRLSDLMTISAPEVAAKLRGDGTDFAFLTPA
ncbi:MAG: hypothetical protein HC802_00995 [Caldilineaceae bacterium]|nr:hypothetical protein [Caldilineaceae bacterium]